jgi:cell division protein FtsB
MREFQAKKRFRKIVNSKIIVVGLLVLLVFMLQATWNVFKKQQDSAANVSEASRELKKLEDRQQLLETEIARLSTDAGIEEEIRSKFSVLKPGENLIVIVDEKGSSTVEVQKQESWWGKFKNLFNKSE